MAREFAQIKLSIWADDDWRDLSSEARYLYLTLLTSPTLTHCGTADWRPTRLGALNGQDVVEVENAGAEMVDSLHLVIDESTEEVLIRSFIRNDGLMKQPRMAVSMANAHAGVASRTLRGVLVHELRRLKSDFPDLAGWAGEKAERILSMDPVDPSDYPLGRGRFRGSFTPGLGQTQGSVSGSAKGSPTPSPTPATTTADSRLTPSKIATADALAENDDFEAFWDVYGKKVGKKAAETKWKVALRKPGVTSALLIDTAGEYVAWERANNEGGRFIKDAARWLNGEHWNDERASRQSRPPMSKAEERIAANFSLVQQLRAEEQQQQASHLRAIEGHR